MPKVILYNPKEKTRLRVPYLPFSLLTVGTALQKAGIEVKIIDARIEEKARAIVASLLTQEVLFFGITLITGSIIHDAIEMARFVKMKKPDLKIVFGGVHASLLPEQTVRYPHADLVVIGPGENTATELALALKNGADISGIPSIAYKKNGVVIVNPDPVSQPMASDEGVDYTMIDLARYLKTNATGTRCLDYLSSRGCPHPCSYCAISNLWKKKIFYYSSEKMVADLEKFARELQINSVHFLDDNFFVNRPRVETFCDELLKRKLSLRFWSMCRIQYFAQYDDTFLLKLRAAGFSTMNFGAESGSQFILDKIKKGITVEQILETARRCHQLGFRGQFSFMMGFPFEKDSDLEMTMKLIDEIHAIDPQFDIQLFPYTPFPRTELAEECIQYGFVPPMELETWAEFEYGAIKMPWLSKKLRERIDTMTTIAWFAFTPETAIKLGGIKGELFKMFGKLAHWRWKHRFFGMPLEWKAINRLARQ